MKFFSLLGILFLITVQTMGNSITLTSGTQSHDFEKACKTLNPFDTLFIKEHTLSLDNFIIEKPIYIIGLGKAVIESKSGGEILTVASDNVAISGISFKGVKTNFLKENAAIRILRKRHFEIVNNTFIDCFFSIYLERARNGLIADNLIIGNANREADSGNGIHAWYCDSLTITRNEISGHRDGIYFEFVNNSTITENYSFNNIRYGLHFMFSNDDQYMDNIFEHNGAGVAVMFSRRINMSGNQFLRNWGNSSYGLLLKEIYDADIIENRFEQNTIAIFVEGSNRIKYKYNTFLRNGWAIKFSGGCENNEIINNNFLYNSLDMLVSTKLADNYISDNFWSEYSGYDLDKDGYGDIPHYPVKLYSYILDQVPESVVLMRSFFINLVNYAEKVSPVFTPKDVFDQSPKMTMYQ